MSDGQSTRSTSRSRQERIRDNQRRSRARKQEYLTDLERRLSECQQSSREADLQRAALLELQIENTRLRELLVLAGVNEPFIETYVAQAKPWTDQLPQGETPGLRRLRPNLNLMPASTGKLPLLSVLNTHNQSQSYEDSGAEAGEPSATDLGNFESPNTLAPYNSFIPNQMPAVEVTDQPLTTQWQFSRPLESFQSDLASEPSFFCEHFHIESKAEPGPADENTILCLVAKQMLDLYDIPTPEMEQIKAKLARGFRRSAMPGSGCGVDTQLLFEVLKDLSTKYG